MARKTKEETDTSPFINTAECVVKHIGKKQFYNPKCTIFREDNIK